MSEELSKVKGQRLKVIDSQTFDLRLSTGTTTFDPAAKPLHNMRFALCGPRRAGDMALILEKQGAIALHRPTIQTVLAPLEVLQTQLRKFAEEGADWVMFTTGAGIEQLHTQAVELGLWEEIYAQLKTAKIGQRGYKSDKALRKRNLEAIAWDEDGTVDGLLEALKPHPFEGQRVFTQLYGQPAPKMVKFLKEQGAVVEELMPYLHISVPEAALDGLIQEILNGELDAVIFTSQPQVEYLLEYAQKTGQFSRLQAAFERVWAIAIGHITAIPLQDAKVRCWYPKLERMGALVTEFAQFVGK